MALALAAWPRPAPAGGYDLPTTCCARHIGLGGAAVAYVSDPSALLHNPAGLAQVRGASVFGGVSLMLGSIEGAPERDVQVRSERAVAPFFLVGGAHRITDSMVGGVAVYPVAAAGARYRYDSALGETEDRTGAIFLEGSPGVAFDLPGDVRVGAGYRVTAVRVERYKKGADAEGPGIDLVLSGVGYTSFRAGAQWQPVDDPPGAAGSDRRALQLGLSYRHRTEVDVSADEGVALSQRIERVRSTFVLPTRLVGGARGDLGRWGAAIDLAYTLGSQNHEAALRTDFEGGTVEIPNVFGWRDSFALQGGVEYRALDDGRLPLQLGFVYDGQTSSRTYPTPFGPPPAATYMATLGAGYDAGRWRASFAYGFRFGQATVTDADLEGADSCAFCGDAGRYGLRLHAITTDFSHAFD